MKKLLAWILALGSVLGLAGCSAAGTRPYKELDTTEVLSATVQLTPPDTTLQIEDLHELVELLKDVVIYEEDSSYTEYAGQGVIVTLTMTDGAQTSIMAYNPFLVIDGVGYRTEYEPCEALNRYANELLQAGTAAVLLEEPPALAVVSAKTSVGALLGTYSWQRKHADGTVTGVEADSPHPLDCKEWLLRLETTERTATLSFAEAPDAIVSVQSWSDADWSNPAAKGEPVEWDGTAIALKSGGHIYEVVAQWDTESGFGGTAHYSFYLNAV